MLRRRKSLCTVGALAVLVMPALSGCAGGQAGSVRAQAGVVGELFQQLKQEDDEAETREIAELRTAENEQREAESQREVEWR
jgi:hypothetical protein